jgi:tRNA A-37 threonylcarbamoyl transferase component Bud32
MGDSVDAGGELATQPSTVVSSAMATVVDASAGTAFADPPAALEAWATFRDLQSEAKQSPIDLHLRRRLWWLSSMTVVLCLTAISSIPVMGGSALVNRMFFAGMVIDAGCGLWMGWMARTKRMTPRNTTVAWLIISAGVCSAILFYGLFSPLGLMVAVFVVFFVGTRDRRAVCVMVYAIFASFHLALVAMLAFGQFPALGTIPFSAADHGRLIYSELFVQLVLAATLLGASAIRRSMVTIASDLEQRARTLGHHELLLDDAKRAFETSLRAAGGGRFSHQILGSYRLGKLIGEGAMGEVYEALDTRSGAPAAVKVLRRMLMEDERIVHRFLTEVRIVRTLSTEHVARVLETAEPGSALPYIAMERLQGRDLRNHLRARVGRRLPLAEADDLLRQIARGVDVAHHAGVVHRDLKPSNLFRTTDGTWKILDFGVSKVVGEHTENAVVGTPNFMSPEQVKSGTVDGRADIFALGAIMYNAITGKLAFTGDNLAAVAMQVAHTEPPPPSAVVSELPPSVDAVVMTALAKDADKRFPTAAAFSEAFSLAIAVRPPDAQRASGADADAV